MTYFCYIESEILSVPHMEPMSAETHDDAHAEARAMLARHASAIAAHVFFGDERVASVRKDGA